IVATTSTGGRRHDAGATAPTTGWVIGQAQTSAAANATATIALFEGYNANAGSAPGGSNTQCQYNNSGSLGGIGNCTWDGTTLKFTNPSVGTGPVTETFTVGTGGVTANTLVITDGSNPAKIVAATGSGAYGVAMAT